MHSTVGLVPQPPKHMHFTWFWTLDFQDHVFYNAFAPLTSKTMYFGPSTTKKRIFYNGFGSNLVEKALCKAVSLLKRLFVMGCLHWKDSIPYWNSSLYVDFLIEKLLVNHLWRDSVNENVSLSQGIALLKEMFVSHLQRFCLDKVLYKLISLSKKLWHNQPATQLVPATKPCHN